MTPVDLDEYNQSRRLYARNRRIIKQMERKRAERAAAAISNVVDVGPRSRWQNPFVVGPEIKMDLCCIPEVTPRMAYLLFYQRWLRSLEQWPSLYETLEELRGKELVCSCTYGEHCHAKVLRILANKPRAAGTGRPKERPYLLPGERARRSA
jgi:hypothetical protein